MLFFFKSVESTHPCMNNFNQTQMLTEQQCHEAEQKAHAEASARRRDVQSRNRFVRHEVENGLLAGIDLCDSPRNADEDLEN